MPWFELAAALVSALGVWLMARRRPWAWPVGLVSVLAYGVVFIDARLYSDALLQGAFGVMILYGWWGWLHHLEDDGRVLPVPLARAPALRDVALGALGALALGAFMHYRTDAALPWLDAALAAFSLVAQWWQARRHTASWWLWIIVDVIYVGMYAYKDLFVTAVLYVGFIALAVAGLRGWQRAFREAATHRSG
ncbi:nicotinamide riboside transporter PnuC [Dokdonella sp.]|uniref:nicotinamide riboside transporter PnuC n=1 Tax=Dokdonella sp. TaxID=2291710 RepID=UPI0031BECD9C|nr:nicotinamide riboside transporter PnuC [Dokdonella sp.]